MSLFRNFPLVVFSLVSGILVVWLLMGDMLSESGILESGESWGILSFDENQDDRLIGEILEAGGFGNFHSESNQIVYIDDFGGLKKAPLDRFPELLEPYDPRNDGYAEKLKLLFVREGKRYFFVPLAGAGSRKKLETALGDIPFKLILLGKKKNLALNLFFGAAALLAAFLIGRDKRRFALQLPVLCAFAWTGPEGLVLAGLLTGLRTLLPDIWVEFFPKRAPLSPTPLRERLLPYRLHFLFIFLLLLFFGFISAFGAIPLPAAGLGFVLFCALEFLGLREERRKAERIRFSAVWMLPKKAKVPVFRKPVVPFAAAAFVLLLVPVFFPGFAAVPEEPPFIMEDYVTPKDYENHLAFQLAFSQKPLGQNGGSNLEYYLAADGLIAVVPGSSEEKVNPKDPAEELWPAETPPFPLEKFRAFLVEYGEGIKTVSFIPMEWISALLLLALCISDFYRQGNRYGGKKKAAFFWDRQAAA